MTTFIYFQLTPCPLLPWPNRLHCGRPQNTVFAFSDPQLAVFVYKHSLEPSAGVNGSACQCLVWLTVHTERIVQYTVDIGRGYRITMEPAKTRTDK
jgi:hypothetical protein